MGLSVGWSTIGVEAQVARDDSPCGVVVLSIRYAWQILGRGCGVGGSLQPFSQHMQTARL